MQGIVGNWLIRLSEKTDEKMNNNKCTEYRVLINMLGVYLTRKCTIHECFKNKQMFGFLSI